MVDTLRNARQKPMPLDGIKIVEYGVFHAGPGASAILGDLGADVVKIESGAGDPERYWTAVAGADMSLPNEESIFFQISNRNKRGLLTFAFKICRLLSNRWASN